MDNDSLHLDRVLVLLDKAIAVRATTPEATDLEDLRSRIEAAYWRIDGALGEDRQDATRLHDAALGLLRRFTPDHKPDSAEMNEAAARLAQDIEALVPQVDGASPDDAAATEADRVPGSRGIVGRWPLDESPGTCEIVGRWEDSGPPDEQSQPVPDGRADHVPRTR